jgi:murein DD-endopeptidase MepM/ murein hydrolase activator NlpD
MAYPVKNPKVTCPYGTKGTVWISGWHQGVDFGAPVGTPVYAVADGIVTSVGRQGPALGKFSPTIKHKFHFKTYYCTYAHVKKSYVKTGDIVKIGQLIAEVGREGNAKTGSHLHFEAQKTPFWQIGGGVNPKWIFRYKGKKKK